MNTRVIIGCLTILILWPSYFFGQKRILSLSVKDSLTKSEVGYASIRAAKSNYYADANENGLAVIDVFENDTLEISRVGYRTKRVFFNQTGNTIEIFLVPKIDTLKSVIVKPLHNNWAYSNFREKNFQTINYSNDTVLSQVAVKIYLPENAKGIRLHQVKFQQKAFAHKFLRLHFYKVNEFGLPGDEILDEILILQPYHHSDGVLSIPLNDLSLYIDGTSFFVGLQWLTKREPIIVSRKSDIGLSVANESPDSHTFYQNFGVGRNWHQLFSNGIRIFSNQNGKVTERKIQSQKPLGMPSNLKIEIDGMLY